MIDLTVAFPVLSSSGTKEEFEKRLHSFIEAVEEEGYRIPILNVKDTFSKEG
jgi:hypothetical protein